MDNISYGVLQNPLLNHCFTRSWELSNFFLSGLSELPFDWGLGGLNNVIGKASLACISLKAGIPHGF